MKKVFHRNFFGGFIRDNRLKMGQIFDIIQGNSVLSKGSEVIAGCMLACYLV